MGLYEAIERCGSVERDRLTAAEICLDECLTILDRHRVPGNDLDYLALRRLSMRLSDAQLQADGPYERRERLIRIRDVLTDAMPMTDADLART
jgi:hypothetical protein